MALQQRIDRLEESRRDHDRCTQEVLADTGVCKHFLEGKGKSSGMFWNVVNQHIAPALTRPWKFRGRGVGRVGRRIIKGVTCNLHAGRTVVYHVGNATWDCQFENVSVWILSGFLLRKCGVQ